MPYYTIVDTKHIERDRLILAPNQAQAIRHVAKRYTAEVASTHAVASMLLDGVKLETASNGHGEEAAQAETRG